MSDLERPETATMEPEIDVVIPVRYGVGYLPQALQSVAAQAADARVVVVDDGAEADLPSLVEAGIAPEVRQVPVEIVENAGRPGIGGGRNTGVALGSAPYVAFLDADDLWPAERTTVLSRLLEGIEPPAMAFGMVEQFVDNGLTEDQLPEAPRPGMVAGGMLITRSTWDLVGPFDDELPVGEFIDWVARARSAGVGEALSDELVLRRRIHGDNTTLHRRNDHRAYADVIRRHLRRRS